MADGHAISGTISRFPVRSPSTSHSTAQYLSKRADDDIRVHQFSMKLTAIKNGQYNDVAEVIQQIPACDPEGPPQRAILRPRDGVEPMPSSDSDSLLLEFKSQKVHKPNPPFTEHAFERIQFQTPTAYISMQRAQQQHQQYYNLCVDLYAEITNAPGGDEWVNIARKMPCHFVVLGCLANEFKDDD
ncbi:hypothetical protein BJX70DRAFT_376596 [Aspergillus crustosus]